MEFASLVAPVLARLAPALSAVAPLPPNVAAPEATPVPTSTGAIDEGAQSVKTLFRQLHNMWQGFITLLPKLVIAAVVLAITWLAARVISSLIAKAANRANSRPSLVNLMRQLSYMAVWVFGAIVAATIVFPGLNVGNLVATLGLTSIALGFAFKDIIENFLAGVLILWRFPIEIGDWIEVEGTVGKIEHVNVRNTQLRQTDGDLVIIPNATIFKNPVVNLTDLRDRRVIITVGIAYSENVDRGRGVIADAVERCRTVRKAENRPIQVFAQEFADSSINFEVAWWTGSTPLETRKSRDEVVASIKRALDDEGIEIPFPYRTLTFKEPLTTVRQAAAGVGGNGDG